MDECSIGNLTLPYNDSNGELDTLGKTFATAIAVVQVTLSVFGAVGNIVGLTVIISTRSLRTVPNFYLGHMAAVDLVTCLWVIPFGVKQTLMGKNTYSTQHCKTLGYVIMINLIVALWSMMLIAVNRYTLIIRGKARYKRLYTKARITITVICVWLWPIAIVVGVPEAFKFGLYGYNAKFGLCFIKTYCFKAYIHTVALVFPLLFLPPFVTITITYSKIVRKLLSIRRRLKESKAYYGLKKPDEIYGRRLSDISVEASSNIVLENRHKSDRTQTEGVKSNEKNVKKTDKENISTWRDNEIHTYNLDIKRVSETTSELDYGVGTKLRPRSNIVLSKIKRSKWRREYIAIMNMIAIFVLLWICWTPVILLYVIDFYGRTPAWIYKLLVNLVYLNSSCNVLLYGLMNPAHRAAHKHLFITLWKKIRLRYFCAKVG